MDGNPVSYTDVSGLEATADGNEKVVKGETLWGIAKRRGTTVEKIRELNGLDPADDKKLPVGKVLQMPEATKSTTQKKNAVKAKQKAIMKQRKLLKHKQLLRKSNSNLKRLPPLKYRAMIVITIGLL